MSTDDPTTEPPAEQPSADRDAVEHYEIRVRGRLSARWGARFDGLTLTAEDDGTTVIRGPIVDQAALHGLLQQLRDLGVALLSLSRTFSDQPTEHPTSPNDPNRATTSGATP